MLESALDKAIPHHERFRKADAVSEALHEAGVKKIRVERVAYEWRYTLADYVDGLRTWATGRFVRGMLDDGSWERLLDRTRAVFAERFPDPLHDRRTVLLASGVKE